MTTTTSWKDHIVFENSNILLTFKGLKCHDITKPKNSVVPIVTVLTQNLEITAITGLSLIPQHDQQN